MTTLLHVEDDPDLADMVQLSFETFGFRGATLRALTVTDAHEILVDTTRYPEIHLVISDMNLPDGSGLDVVRDVRTQPARACVPILILSGTTDQPTVDRAYALGANSFVAKSAGAHPFPEVLKSLYQHWLRDARLPRGILASRTQVLVAKAIKQRARASMLFARLSQDFDAEPAHAQFWMTRALRQGNLSNLLAFLQQQIEGRELPEPFIEQLEAIQRREGRGMDAIERAIDAHPQRTTDLGRDVVIELMSNFEPEAFVQATSHLFPVAHAAVTALREVVTRDFDDVLAWLETQPDLPDQRLARLRAITAHLHALVDASARVAH